MVVSRKKAPARFRAPTTSEPCGRWENGAQDAGNRLDGAPKRALPSKCLQLFGRHRASVTGYVCGTSLRNRNCNFWVLLKFDQITQHVARLAGAERLVHRHRGALTNRVLGSSHRGRSGSEEERD